jgi:hypothetical protein
MAKRKAGSQTGKKVRERQRGNKLKTSEGKKKV